MIWMSDDAKCFMNFLKIFLLISITILLYIIDTIFYVYTKLNFNWINTIGETRTQILARFLLTTLYMWFRRFI